MKANEENESVWAKNPVNRADEGATEKAGGNEKRKGEFQVAGTVHQ